MYRVYAHDPQARINLGIRRRLAPLLGNDRRRIELMNGAAVLAAGHAGHLLRRRDRHGRQHLPRRPQRRAHADAVERRPQRRLLARQPAAALPAGHHRPRVPLRGGQRRGAAEQPALAAVVDEAADRAAQAATRRSAAARIEFLSPEQPQGAGVRAPATRTSASWSSPTCRASCSTSSSTCRAFAGHDARSSCSAARRSRAIGELPYLLTLGPHAFYWFALDAAARAGSAAAADGAPRRAGRARRGDWRALLLGERAAPRSRRRCPAACRRGAGSAARRGASSRLAIADVDHRSPTAPPLGIVLIVAGRLPRRATPRPTSLPLAFADRASARRRRCQRATRTRSSRALEIAARADDDGRAASTRLDDPAFGARAARRRSRGGGRSRATAASLVGSSTRAVRGAARRRRRRCRRRRCSAASRATRSVALRRPADAEALPPRRRRASIPSSRSAAS